jgi:hypothetical protein
VVSLLAQLGARGNWHRMTREFLFGAPPTSELGKRDAAWRHARNLEGVDFALTPEGLQRVSSPVPAPAMSASGSR